MLRWQAASCVTRQCDGSVVAVWRQTQQVGLGVVKCVVFSMLIGVMGISQHGFRNVEMSGPEDSGDLQFDSVWCLKPLDQHDSLTVFARDEQAGENLVPFFTSREQAVTFLKTDYRYTEFVEPYCLPDDHDVLVLLDWFESRGYEYVAINPEFGQSAAIPIWKFRQLFEV